jgi:uncharacterized membrane protein
MLRDTNPKHWKLLIFYYNPGEPSLFAAKRSGPPFALNFANPTSWSIATAIGVLAAIVAVIRTFHLAH